jgi:hypothetical protein
MTAPQMLTRNSTSPHARERTSRGNAGIAAPILRRKWGRHSILPLCTTPLISPQKKKSMGITSGIHVDQLIGLPLPIHGSGNCSSREVRTVPQKMADAPCYWEMRPSAPVVCGNTQFTGIRRQTALVEEAGSNISARFDAAPHVNLLQ